jgi:hypothetical protein
VHEPVDHRSGGDFVAEDLAPAQEGHVAGGNPVSANDPVFEPSAPDATWAIRAAACGPHVRNGYPAEGARRNSAQSGSVPVQADSMALSALAARRRYEA